MTPFDAPPQIARAPLAPAREPLAALVDRRQEAGRQLEDVVGGPARRASVARSATT